MNLSNFVAYVKQAWKNKPDTSTPLSAERLTHQEEGIKGNSDAIQELAAAVVSQIVNNPDKIASMAALYAVNQKVTTLDGKVGDTAQLPSGTADVASAIAQLYSNLTVRASDRSECITNNSVVTQKNSVIDLWEGNMHNIGFSLVISNSFASGDTIIGQLPYNIKNNAVFTLNSWITSAPPIMGTVGINGSIMIARRDAGDIAEYRGNVTVFTDNIISD